MLRVVLEEQPLPLYDTVNLALLIDFRKEVTSNDSAWWLQFKYSGCLWECVIHGGLIRVKRKKNNKSIVAIDIIVSKKGG